MAKTNNLTDFLTSEANKFRSVLGTNQSINPQNFDDLIDDVYDKGYNDNPGVDTSDADAQSSDILSGKTAYVNGTKVTGNIPTKVAHTYTPTTSNQVIASGQYLSGNQTILGDNNLTSDNIVVGESIFNVDGNFQGYKRWTSQDIIPESETSIIYLNEDTLFDGRTPRCIAILRVAATSSQYTNTTRRILSLISIFDNEGSHYTTRAITYAGASSGSSVSITQITNVTVNINENLENSYIDAGSNVYFWPGFTYRVYIGG